MIRLTNRLFNSQPILAHCPGPVHDGWRRFEAAVCSAPPVRVDCDRLTIITYNGENRPDKPNGAFERSLARLGVEPLVLGKDEAEWANIRRFWLTADALDTVTTPYVLGADSCDVVMLDDPNILVDRFERHFTCDLLYNATGSRCWPELPRFVEFESSLPMAAVAQGRHWLNAGVWIGRTDFCRRYFRAMAREVPVEGYETSDQAVVKRTWPDWRPRVEIDYLCTLFQWFNEVPAVLVVERPLAARQQQLLELLQPLGERIEGVEVGVFDGYTSDALLRSFPHLRLWMVDSWTPYNGQARISGIAQAAFDRAQADAIWWTNHAAQRRNVLHESSLAAAQRFASGVLDFAFIDANHMYQSVRGDVRTWWPKIRAGGILCGHDYGIDRDAQHIWGVRRAVDEFAAELQRPVSVGADGVWWIYK